MEVKCHFETPRWFGTTYYCHVEDKIISSDRKEIRSLAGTHQAGKTNNNVDSLTFQGSTMNFVPLNLTKTFPNLKHLSLRICGLEKLSREDLRGLENIEVFEFGVNKLTSLPDDLFVGMKKLRQIYFNYNQIERMSSNLLVPIKATLRFADFRSNTKINDHFDIESADKNDLATFMRLIDEKCLPSASQSETVFSGFSKFKTLSELTDFTIKAREKEFKLHKMVCAAQSPVFEKIFTNGTKDLSEPFNKIKNFDDETLASFIDFFYTGKVDEDVNAIEMFELAAVFEVRELKGICVKRILTKLDEANAVELFNLAHRHQSEEMKTKSFEIVKKMFPGMDKSFVEKPKEVNDLVALKGQMEALKTQMDALMNEE